MMPCVLSHFHSNLPLNSMKTILKNQKIGDDFTAVQYSHLRSSQMRAHSRCKFQRTQSPAPNRLQCRAYPHCPIVAHHETSSHWLVPGFSCPCSVGNPCSQLNVFASVHLHFVVGEQGESNMDWCGEINIEQPRPSRPPTRSSGLPRWEFHRALASQVPRLIYPTWTGPRRGTRSRISLIVRAISNLAPATAGTSSLILRGSL